jgi:hypothetical protein|tara:strand:- start:482 stop:730 length:249 start_codon:yes stop_codon:yes gene_type:complete
MIKIASLAIVLILFCNQQFAQSDKITKNIIDLYKIDRAEDLYKCGEDDKNLYFVFSDFSSFSHDSKLFSKEGKAFSIIKIIQ